MRNEQFKNMTMGTRKTAITKDNDNSLPLNINKPCAAQEMEIKALLRTIHIPGLKKKENNKSIKK